MQQISINLVKIKTIQVKLIATKHLANILDTNAVYDDFLRFYCVYLCFNVALHINDLLFLKN